MMSVMFLLFLLQVFRMRPLQVMHPQRANRVEHR